MFQSYQYKYFLNLGIRFFLETSNRYQCEFAPSYWYAYSYWIVLKIVNNYRVQSTMISIIDDCSCIISSGSSMTHYYFLPYFFSLFSIVEAVCDLENDGKWTVGDRRLWLRDWMCHKASLRPRCPSLNQLTWKKNDNLGQRSKGKNISLIFQHVYRIYLHCCGNRNPHLRAR